MEIMLEYLKDMSAARLRDDAASEHLAVIQATEKEVVDTYEAIGRNVNIEMVIDTGKMRLFFDQEIGLIDCFRRKIFGKHG